MEMVQVRYIVEDVQTAIVFYRDLLGFRLEERGDETATVVRGALRLHLNLPELYEGDAGKTWNRIAIEVESVEEIVADLRERGVAFRTPVVETTTSRHVTLEDPSRNPIELVELLDTLRWSPDII